MGARKRLCPYQAAGVTRANCGGVVSVGQSPNTLTRSTVPQVMVINSEGLFQAYNIDLDNGGECSLMKEFA